MNVNLNNLKFCQKYQMIKLGNLAELLKYIKADTLQVINKKQETKIKTHFVSTENI